MQLTPLSSNPISTKDLLASIGEIRQTAGAPSISCGVLHHGRVLFTHSEGFANIELQTAPDMHTIYSVASNTKAFISALCGILVNEGKLSWTAPISTYLGDFDPIHDSEIGRRATLFDLCSHGTGLASLDCVGAGFFQEFLNDGAAGVQIASNLPPTYDFRSHWLYNNFLLGVVGDVISKVCGKRSGLVMRDRIFEPLGMTRSFTRNDEYADDDNSARGYSVLDSGSCLPLQPPALEDGSLQGASGYVRSSVHDMLIWANAVMDAEQQDQSRQVSEAEQHQNPLRHVRLARSAHRPVVLGEGQYENSYGLGWFRHMLPSEFLSSIGPNFSLLPEPPIINKDGPPRLVVGHWGDFGGYLSAFYTFPETRSTVIVLANCNGARCDPTDLIAQAVCQELFDMRPRVSLEHSAKLAAKHALLQWENLVQEWVKNRIQNTPLPPLDELVGSYVNEGFKLTISVSRILESEVKRELNPELLSFNLNSMPRQTARLRHYHYDTWTFLPNSRDDAAKKGMEAYLKLPRLLMNFVRAESGRVFGIDWDLQAGSYEGPDPDMALGVPAIRFTKVEEG